MIIIIIIRRHLNALVSNKTTTPYECFYFRCSEEFFLEMDQIRMIQQNDTQCIHCPHRIIIQLQIAQEIALLYASILSALL